ncbi:MAG: hypothetical protein M3R49_05085 [Chloroflexota bacterium]|nr:hypothetical protein [Chloroflexota bacterium]
MTTPIVYRIDPEAASHLVPRGSVILVETDEGSDPRYDAVRRSALRMARAAQASVVLYDRSSGSAFSDPYASGPWTADVNGPRGDRSLAADELSALGREALRGQLVAAARAGVPARAWLARGVGAPAMAEAVRRTGARLVVRAANSHRPSLLQRLMRGTPTAYRRALRVVVVNVEHGGAVAVDELSCPVARNPVVDNGMGVMSVESA